MVKWKRTVATVGEGENVSFVRLHLRNPLEDSYWAVERDGERKGQYNDLFAAITAAYKINENEQPEKAEHGSQGTTPDSEARPSVPGEPTEAPGGGEA